MTTIETRFLANAEIKTTLQMTEVNTTLRAIDRVEEKNITEKVRLGKLMIPAHEVFKSADFKAKMENDGISWNLDQFSKAVFGRGKSQFYKYIQCAKAVLETPNLIRVYTDLVKSTLDEDNDIEKIEVGMDSFNYYVKHGELEEVVKARQSAESSEDESSDDESSEVESSDDESNEDSLCEWTMAEKNGVSARKVDGAIIYDENNYSKTEILALLQKMHDDVLNS